MNFLCVRLVLWFFTLAAFPIPAALVPWSFQVEVLQRITLAAALPPGAPHVELSERVLVYLERAEKKEIDPWRRDDYRIAWITTLWSHKGVPDWSWHKGSSPYAAATYQVLQCLPDEVWPRLLAERREKLGPLYEQVWGAELAPRKPVQSVKSVTAARMRRVA